MEVVLDQDVDAALGADVDVVLEVEILYRDLDM